MKDTLPALPSRSAADISALELLQQTFPGKIRLDSQETAAAIGITRGSIRTLRSRGAFKIPSQTNGGNHYFDTNSDFSLIRTGLKKTAALCLRYCIFAERLVQDGAACQKARHHCPVQQLQRSNTTHPV